MSKLINILLCAMIVTICNSHIVFAAGVSIDHNIYYSSDGGGGFAAVAEYGPDYVLVSVQGDYPHVTATASLDYYYNIASGSNVTVDYSLMGEMTTYDGGRLSGNVGVGIYEYNSSFHGIWNGTLIGGDSINASLATTGHFENPLEDHQLSTTWDNSFWQLHITMSAYLNGVSRDSHEGADSWYSGTLYADPIVTMNGTVTDPIGGYYSVTQQTLSEGEGWQVVPIPSSILLLGTGLVGCAGALRRRKKNQA